MSNRKSIASIREDLKTSEERSGIEITILRDEFEEKVRKVLEREEDRIAKKFGFKSLERFDPRDVLQIKAKKFVSGTPKEKKPVVKRGKKKSTKKPKPKKQVPKTGKGLFKKIQLGSIEGGSI